MKPNQYLAPLELYRRRKSHRDSQGESKEPKRNSKRELQKTSQRDPTPYSLAVEHGGKEKPVIDLQSCTPFKYTQRQVKSPASVSISGAAQNNGGNLPAYH